MSLIHFSLPILQIVRIQCPRAFLNSKGEKNIYEILTALKVLVLVVN